MDNEFLSGLLTGGGRFGCVAASCVMVMDGWLDDASKVIHLLTVCMLPLSGNLRHGIVCDLISGPQNYIGNI
jgi:hypothetical protein